MNYDRLALSLLVRGSSRGFRKALKQSPGGALAKAGFDPCEIAQILAVLNKIKATQPLSWHNAFERAEVGFAFQNIAVENAAQNTTASDDWSTC
jgi:hypothetical protein